MRIRDARSETQRERRLVFEDDRLEDIAAEVNRYTSGHIRVVRDTARNNRITGTFDAEDPQSLLLFLASGAGA